MFVEVVYSPKFQEIIRKQVPFSERLTVGTAIEQSGLDTTYPEILDAPVGVFSNIVTRDTPVKPGDRIEIYRPLRCDPKEKRRQRAMKA